MSVLHLTDESVADIRPANKTHIHYDDRLKGFGVRVTASGHKSWIAEYRPGGGRNTAVSRQTLGSTATVKEREARHKARSLLAHACLGGDPSAEKIVHRNMSTVKDFAEVFMRDRVREHLKPSTQKTYRRHLDKIIIPRIGSLKIDAISCKMVRELHREIARTGVRRPRREGTANRVLATLSAMFRHAEKEEEILPKGSNPVRGVEKYRENPQTRYLTLQELERIGETLHEAETIGLTWTVDESKPNAKHLAHEENRRSVIDPVSASAIRLFLFTGMRSGELLGLKWEWLDLDSGVTSLPDSKTGAKDVLLNSCAVEVLAAMPRVSPYVFPSLRNPNKPRTTVRGAWNSILRHAGVRHTRIHETRHTHASVGINSGLGLPIIGKLLGHGSPTTTKRYAHLETGPVREASELIGLKLVAALEARVTQREGRNLPH